MKLQNPFLIAAAITTLIAAIAHLGCIIFGAEWYRFFGAGEQMAQMAEAGLWQPTLVTALISSILIIWSLIALSGAGVIRRLPLLRTALALISAVFILRGLGFVFLMPAFPENSLTFWLVSSGICLAIGTLYCAGLIRAWDYLRGTMTNGMGN